MNWKTVRSYLMITLGTVLMAVGVYFFEFANNFSTGGTAGLAQMISEMTGFLTPAQLASLFNVILLIVGMIVLGKAFTAKTIYCSLLLTLLLNLFEQLVPISAPFTGQKVVELFIDMILVSVGAALIFVPKICIKCFSAFGIFMRVLSIGGLMCAVFTFLTPFTMGTLPSFLCSNMSSALP